MDGFATLKNAFEETWSHRFCWECSCHCWRRPGIHPGRMKKLGRIGSVGNAVVIAGEDAGIHPDRIAPCEMRSGVRGIEAKVF